MSSKKKIWEEVQSGFRGKNKRRDCPYQGYDVLLLGVDSGYLNICVLPDITAALMVCHSFLLNWSESAFVTSTLLSWIKSYLPDRQNFVSISNYTAPFLGQSKISFFIPSSVLTHT